MSVSTLGVVGGSVIAARHEPARLEVLVDHGAIASIRGDVSGPTLDATGCTVVPGFIDAQVNGAFGNDLTSEPHRILEVAAGLPAYGVTAFCPTVITGPTDVVPAAITAVAVAQQAWNAPDHGARVLGLHAEGPYISADRLGTHPIAHARPPSVDEVTRWLDLATAPDRRRALGMVTLAPELPGALDVVDTLVAAGVTVCAGHTDATAAEILASEEHGITAMTHLFNAMSPMHHRSPGAVAAAMASSELVAGLIVDGLHVDPIAVAAAWNALGPERIALITDCIAALGTDLERLRVGEVEVSVAAGEVRNGDGVLAGSVLSMDQALRNVMRFTGCSLVHASRAASATAARLIGTSAAGLGTIEVGRPADLVLLDGSRRVVATVIDGVVVHDPEDRSSS